MTSTIFYGTGLSGKSSGRSRQNFGAFFICITLMLSLLIAMVISPASATGIPTISGIVPDSGPDWGGYNVTITGTNFTTPATVLFGSSPAASLVVINDSSIVAVVPSHTVGTVDITVTTIDGTSTTIAADKFTYNLSPPVADFTSDITTGVVPFAVTFTDTSTGTRSSWNWSFGDSSFSDVQNPVHTYTNPGWYSVTLIANNTQGSGQLVKTQYINAAVGGSSSSTDIPGIAIVTPSYTPQPLLNQSSLSGPLTVNGNNATVTNPSSFLSSAVFYYDPIITDVNGNVTGTLQSVQLITTPLISTLASYGTTTVSVALNLGQYTSGKTILILMSDAPSATDAAAFSAAAGTTRPLQSLGYEIDIDPLTPYPYPYLSNADIYFTVPLTWSTTYGSDNIRLFRIHDSPYSVSVLPASLYSTSSTTATYRATTPGFSRFSPGAISPAALPPTPTPTPSPPPTPLVPSSVGGDNSDSGSGPGQAPAAVPKVEIAPVKEAPPKDAPAPIDPGSPQDAPGAAAVSKADLPAQAAPVSPAAGPVAGTSFSGNAVSALQEGGARAGGFVTGGKGPVPADSFLPPRLKPLGAVAAGVAVAGAVALAGSAGTQASGGLIGTILGRILTFLQHLFKPVTDFISDRFVGHVEDHTAGSLERHISPLSQSLDATRNSFIPGNPQLLLLSFGAVLYGLAFVVAERAGMVPVVIGTYILVSGLVVVLHELVHHLVARYFVMKSELIFNPSGLLMTFFTAWFFGNVFSQPLTTKMPEDTGSDRKARGITMLAGPLVSLGFAGAFALLIPVGGIWTMIGTTGLGINLISVVFSLIPVKPLDGQPVFTWNRVAWAVVFIPVFAIYLLAYLL